MKGTHTGRSFGRYQLLECLGAGGMGEVYRARDDRLGRDVAIKVIRMGTGDEDRSRRLKREANTLSKLNHPNIAAIYDFDRDGDLDYVVMELVAGETLAARLKDGPLDEEDVLRIGVEIAAGLAEAHEQGVVHRDLKPGNVMRTRKGHLKLLDFGLAQQFQAAAMTVTASDTGGSVSGTFPYMAPEQLRNQQVGPTTDIWALGVVLYELSTGRRPFGGDDIASIVDDILNRTPEPVTALRPSLSQGLSFVIQKALSKTASARYQSAAELGAALQALMLGTSKTTAFPVVSPRRARMPWRWIGAAAALVAVAAGAWWFANRAVAPPPSTHLSVLVGAVENRTGDAGYDALLPELLTTTLELSRMVDVYPRTNVGLVLRRMQRDPSAPIDETTGREICQREGLHAVILQSITKLGDGLVLVVRAITPDGTLLASTQQTLDKPTDLPARLDDAGKTLRQMFGESSVTVSQATPLAEVTSKSLEAVRAYSSGRQRIYAGDPRGAIADFQRAVDIDPDFAMAQAALGTAYTNVLDYVRAESHFRTAAALVARAPEIERQKILGDFNMIRRNYDAACRHFEVLGTMRPRDSGAPLMLGLCSAMKLDFPAAIAATQRAYDMAPSPRTQINRALIKFVSGDAKFAVDETSQLRATAPLLMQAGFVEGKAHLALGEFDRARAVYSDMIAAGGDAEVEGHVGMADVARSTGRFEAARRELQTAYARALQRGNATVAAGVAADQAELALIEKRPDDYRKAIEQTNEIPPDIYLAFRIGRARARGGRASHAAEALKAIEALSTGPSRQQDAIKALLRAEIALGQAQPADAIREAQAAVSHEPSTVAYETLARSFVAAGRGSEAIPGFEYVVAHPTERCYSYDTPACYGVSDALYWVGRLKSDAGDAAGAAAALKRFVTAWTGAAGQPMYDDAMKRLGVR